MKNNVSMLLVIPVALMSVTSVFLTASPARAASVSGTTYKSHTPHIFFKSAVQSSNVQPFVSNNLIYNGGPVMAGTTSVYAIFWEPSGNVSANYNSLINRYFQDIGGSKLYQINKQYTQSGGSFPSNAVLAGSWVDTGAYPETPLLDSDIQNEVTHAQQVNGWSSSINKIFFVFTERSEDLCIDSSLSQCASNAFCAYHGLFGSNTIYAAMPYAKSFSCNTGYSPNNDDADQTINMASHEQMGAATDPLFNAWISRSGLEIGDMCAWMFPPPINGADVVWNNHPYIVQKEWDNISSGCVLPG